MVMVMVIHSALVRSHQSMVMVMVINSALVRTHQSTYSGSFGPVLPPGWIDYTRSAAVPLDVEGLTRPPLAAQCPLRRPGVGVVLLSHCWLWGRGGGWGRGACTAPVLSILGPSGGLPRPSPRSCAHAPPATRSPVPFLSLAPSYHLRVRRRPRIGSLPPLSSSAPSASSPQRIPRPCSPLASRHRRRSRG